MIESKIYNTVFRRFSKHDDYVYYETPFATSQKELLEFATDTSKDVIFEAIEELQGSEWPVVVFDTHDEILETDDLRALYESGDKEVRECVDALIAAIRGKAGEFTWPPHVDKEDQFTKNDCQISIREYNLWQSKSSA